MKSRRVGQRVIERTDEQLSGYHPREALACLLKPVHASMPFGTTNDDLYDEHKSRKFHKYACLVAAFVGLASTLLTASWAFACMPSEASLHMALTSPSKIDTSLVPRAYVALRWRLPKLLGILSCLAFTVSSTRADKLDSAFFCGDDLPSATLFNGSEDDGASRNMIAYVGLSLVILGTVAAVSAAPGNPLWPSRWALMATVTGCTCISVGSGLVASRIALAFAESRARCIDDYDLLTPDCGADDDYKRRIYLDHAEGISELLGAAFILLALSCLFVRIPDHLGTVQVYDGVFAQSSSLPDGYVRAVGLVNALRGFAPAILIAFAIALLAKTALRSRRFSVEWSITEVPAYSDAYEGARSACLSKAAFLSVACIVLYFGSTALANALGDGTFAGKAVSDFMASVVSLLTMALLEVMAGLTMKQVALHVLLSEGSYTRAHENLALFDDLEEVLAAIDGLMLVRSATFVITLVGIGVSTLAVESLVLHHPITSWSGVLSTMLQELGIL